MQLPLLRPVVDRAGPWATVYTEIPHTTEDAAKQQELIAEATGAKLLALGADEATSGALRDALAAPQQRAGEARGSHALFATEGRVVLDVPLPGPPPAPLVTWGPVPRITPLLAALGQSPLCLVVRLDRHGADFCVTDGRTGHEAGQVEGADRPLHRTASADWSETHFQAKVENTWERNAQDIADAIADAYEKCGAEAVLLVGDTRERRAVHDRLPEPLRSVTHESEHGGRADGADTDLVERDVAQVCAGHEHDRVTAATERFRTGADPVGKPAPDTAAGIPALVEAAREHRIGTLLVDPRGADAGREVWVGSRSDQLGVRASELTYLGEPHPAAARADDALIRSAAATGADIVVVPDPEQAPAGGLGAILRWSDEAPPRS
ncbi:hypothetical protein MUU72_14835 [Streptomyces sp. RS10V-4]|uniref:baeRF2 domain-containing protein n=1 Tax=Streptomyces rhizoryzae TaxID=2932493 RepID=UPI002003532F|nr:Vms1/Ankzf1 family peptidyl-tRNA hydrolase [Streptomyces rhizoryzae]MCK7624362.1 hypothetical protein [Streptomyces rhizoryzae]